MTPASRAAAQCPGSGVEPQGLLLWEPERGSTLEKLILLAYVLVLFLGVVVLGCAILAVKNNERRLVVSPPPAAEAALRDAATAVLGDAAETIDGDDLQAAAGVV